LARSIGDASHMISWLTVAIDPVRQTKNKNAQIGSAIQP
jgi:hypothetical protein